MNLQIQYACVLWSFAEWIFSVVGRSQCGVRVRVGVGRLATPGLSAVLVDTFGAVSLPFHGLAPQNIAHNMSPT
eukprot:m.970056 g.970056  ORF g.970056 m.970056 type:complete len:74 (+) comp23922_c1_seq12:671-892(+)